VRAISGNDGPGRTSALEGHRFRHRTIGEQLFEFSHGSSSREAFALLRQGKLGRILLDLDRALRQFFAVDGFGETAEMAREEIFGNRTEGDMALSRSWVLLVNRAGRSQPACLYFNALGHSSPSQIGSEIAYSWPM
jgi:hypothetical protein